MAIQDTNSTTWTVKAESSWGAAFPSASGVGQQVPITGESLSLNKTLTQAETIRSDRARAGAAVNTSGVEGDVNFELAPVANTEGVALLMEGALTSTWSAADSETASGSTSTQFTGLTTNTVEKGQVIKCGSGSNAGVYQATSVSASTVTVAGGGLTAAQGGAITSRRLDNASSPKSFLVEKNFPGVDAASDFMAYNGVRVGGMGINLAAQQNITGSFSFSGKSSQVSGSSVYASTSAPASSNPFSATVNAGNVVVDGTVVDATSGGAVRSVVPGRQLRDERRVAWLPRHIGHARGLLRTEGALRPSDCRGTCELDVLGPRPDRRQGRRVVFPARVPVGWGG
jgi:hypothetical protein